MTENTTKPKQTDTIASENNDKPKRSVLSRLSNWFMPKNGAEPGVDPGEIKQDNLIDRRNHRYTNGEPSHSEGREPSYHRRQQPKPFKPRTSSSQASQPLTESDSSRTYHGRQAGRRKSTAKPKGSGPAVPKHKKSDQSTHTPMDKSARQVKLLINRDEPEECRIALVEGGRVESFHVETIVHAHTKGNIYKGKITAVEPNLQAAFVDIGTEKNAFLPFSDVHPEYYTKEVPQDSHWKNLKIQEVLRKGQEVLVQIVKEAVGNKGANVTTFLSLPGRYLVLMPGSESSGVSKKIENEKQRARLRKLIESLKLPEGIGYIVRTASEGITKKAIEQDFSYLLNLWQEVKNRGQELPSPSLIYEERDVFSRFLRDHFTSDIQEILVDNEEAHEQVVKFLQLLPASQKQTRAKLYQGSKPIFNQHQIEQQIDQIYQPRVNLPSGGSIVISPTEALVAIDVNSGRTSKDKSFEKTIFLANMEAAEELARQLRLRDLGGLIVVDFIDMREMRHVREVEKKVKESMKRDKAKVDISRISKFGLMQISRQKLASPIQMESYKVCDHCQGRGLVQSVETLALVYLRRIQTGVVNRNVVKAECKLPLPVAQYLLNKKREDLVDLENRYNVVISIEPVPEMPPSEGRIEFIREAQE